ncbi:MAG: Gfo/Idh/MocA family oxidoreductase [Alphaproteobacteria bacterium]|nr:Gfo/Idh/MocA family oxidoreductase [Alphaproteobacteria bacterium]
MRTLQIGIVGGGWMGKVHAMSYRTARSAFGPEPASPVVAVMADVTMELAEAAARECGVDRAVADWRRIVEDPQIDIVDICTPNDMHLDVAMAAIAAGKHVYCEKPLANTVDAARQMADAAEQRGVTTMVGFNYIQNPVHGLARAAIARGELGEITYVKLIFNSDFMSDRNLQHTWRNDITRAGSGVIGDIGAHCLSYFYHLVDREIEEVLCDLRFVIPDHPAPLSAGAFRSGAQGDPNRRVPNTTDDMATVLFRLRGGGSGHMEMSRVSTGVRFDIGYEIIGTEGSLRYDYERINDLDLYRDSGPIERRGFTRMRMGPTDPRYAALLPVSALGLGYNDYKAMEAREMIEAVATGRPAYPDFRFGQRVQEVVDACQRSHAQHAWVKLPG